MWLISPIAFSNAAVRDDAILIDIGKPYSCKKIGKDEVVDILASDSKKHIIWVGHGGLTNSFGHATAMGLPLSDVSDIIERVPNINLWDLHSCYILGNIRHIMSQIQQRNSTLIINNGAICESSPPREYNDSIKAYFQLVSQISEGQEGKMQKKLAKIFALQNSFAPENHPHLILQDSRTITPLTSPKMIAKVSSLTEEDTQSLQRLYIDKLITEEPLHLPKRATLLPGIAELNATFLLSEVKTPLPFAEFVLQAFGHAHTSPYAGHTLFMMAKLECADGIYEHVVYGSDKEKPTTMFSQNGCWSTFDVVTHRNNKFFKGKKNAFLPCSKEFALERLQQEINQAVLSEESFQEHGMKAEAFYDAVRTAFQLPESLLANPLPPMQSPQLSEHNNRAPLEQFSHHAACSSEEAPLFQAIALQDKDAMAPWIEGLPLQKLANVMEFCVQRNLTRSFKWLLETMNKKEIEIRQNPLNQETCELLDKLLQQATPFGELSCRYSLGDSPLYQHIEAKYSVINLCIKMKRLEMLKQFDSDLISEDDLREAARSGTPEIFVFVRDHCCTSSVDYAALTTAAEEEENWEMVHFLATQTP